VSKAKTVLMVGGPADGRWMVADGPMVIVVEPMSLDWSTTTVDIKQVQYFVMPIAMFGFSLNVAVAERDFSSSQEQNKAILRALLQRDVAEAMGATQ
jgi:hypothetical protein